MHVMRKSNMYDNFGTISRYHEGKYFKYGEKDPRSLEGVRHFTQLVWKDSKQLGVGKAEDDIGKIYVVCFYQPPGNVAGEFAENVQQPIKEETESVSPEKEIEIQTLPAKPETVRSMERIYAVPSEKLRVWSIWLTKVGELADEWQRWLRAHIDLIIRLAIELQGIEKKSVTELEKKEETVAAVTQTTQVTKVTQDGVNEIQVEEASSLREESVEPVFSEAALDEDAADIFAEDSEITLTMEPSDATIYMELPEKPKDIAAEPSLLTAADVSDLEDVVHVWPLGTPWIHLGQEDEVYEEPFERLPIPRTEQEMREFVKKFTHEATIYRSYYKHWEDVAKQATNEVGCRMVMATWIVQGKDTTGKVKQQPCPRPMGMTRSRATLKSKKSVVSAKSKKSAISARSKAMSKKSEQIAESEAASTPTPESPTETETSEPSEEDPFASESVATVKSVAVKASKIEEPKIESIESIEIQVDDVVRDCARAAEPIPYHFYVRAEPDIDIAIEHDDEVVIPEDTDRERIVGDYRRLFFNLFDKPCKGGKPWIA
ncbi:uncharacterized protein LOC108623446 isoform X2 [Ceratina calcarata]|uniref:Uncharacterized protein LOC108623446 isoform X2 n=1 Tax=Ceratina calcarata TaxID=156304 RepID=A0AAJ7RZC1_9HYME|nr:uncharacterized protein LOC108623446 isoform X2 [Ceratina calcarata]